MSPKIDFTNIFNEKITRPGADKFLEWQTGHTDFFGAPASTRFHLAGPEGLVKHSLNVYYRLREEFLWEKNRGDPSEPAVLSAEEEETIAIVGLLHDVCKCNMYIPIKKSRKTGAILPNGKPEWEDYMGYDVKDTFPYGHGEKSVYLISAFMRLKTPEALAIRWHMGAWNDGEARNADNAFSACPLALLVHIADMKAT